jgi:hypothetical protein
MLTVPERQGRNEDIASTRYVHDIPTVVSVIPQRTAKCSDVNADIGINDNEFSPNPDDQFLVGHDPAGILHENDQYVERPATDLYAQTVLHQQALRRMQLERTKNEHTLIGWAGGDHSPSTPLVLIGQ